MKTLLALCFASLVPAAAAAELPQPAFPDSKIEAPPLPLLEDAKRRLPPVFGDVAPPLRAANNAIRQSRRPVSRMPILRPAEGVDHRIAIATPNESIDHKMKVVAPAVEESE